MWNKRERRAKYNLMFFDLSKWDWYQLISAFSKAEGEAEFRI